MGAPLVTFITCARNAAQTLTAALNSIAAQDYPNVESVVVDDGSTDGTFDLARAHPAVTTALRAETGIGRGAARNLAVEHSRGEYLSILDADDISLQQRVARQIELLTASPKAVACGGQALFMTDRGRIWKLTSYPTDPGEIARSLQAGRMSVCHGGSTIRKSSFDRSGGYNPGLERAQDLDLYARLSRLGPIIGSLDHMVIYRHNPILRPRYWLAASRWQKAAVALTCGGSIGAAEERWTIPLTVRYAASMAKRSVAFARSWGEFRELECSDSAEC